MDASNFIETQSGWSVVSSDKTELYDIQEAVLDCSCQLICVDCKSCIHRNTCYCADSSITWNMCKHIHLVCGCKNSKETQSNNDESDSLCIIDVTETELQSIVNTLGKNQQPKIVSKQLKIESLKEEVLNGVKSLLDLAQSIEQVEVIQKSIISAKPTILALQKKSCFGDFESVSSSLIFHLMKAFHINVDSILQRKKLTARKSMNNFNKPTAEECQRISLSLALNSKIKD
ncbi:uncharacterized protein TNCV_627961 [Trichonephila clavipes]|nr:uncharacterized protein TNCV_627961 [Trichonephila clavipes]